MDDTTRLSREEVNRFLRVLPEAEEQRILDTCARIRFRLSWTGVIFGCVVGPLIAIVLVAVVLLLLAFLLGSAMLMAVAGALGVLVLCGGPVVVLVTAGMVVQHMPASMVRPFVISTEQGWRLQRCPRCAHDQAGHESSACPECGAKVEYERHVPPSTPVEAAT